MPIIVALGLDLLVAFLCLYFGFQIYFRGRFDFINDYMEEKRQGVVGENYAKKVGKILFIMGILFLIVGIIFIVIKVIQFLISAMFFLAGLMILSLVYNRIKNKFR